MVTQHRTVAKADLPKNESADRHSVPMGLRCESRCPAGSVSIEEQGNLDDRR